MSRTQYLAARDEYEAASVELEKAEAEVERLGVNMASVAIIARAADRKVKARERLRTVCLGD